MGHHDISTWIMAILATGQDAPVQSLLPGPILDYGEAAEHWRIYYNTFA